MVKLVTVYNKETGAKAQLPESALRFLPDFALAPSQVAEDETSAPAQVAEDEAPQRSRGNRQTNEAAPAAENEE